MRRSVVTALAGLLGVASVAVDAMAQPASVAGEYIMEGKGVGPRDIAYSGTCTFKTSGTLYDVACYNKDTNHTYSGKGIQTGNQFAIIIGDHLKGDHLDTYVGEYLVTYTIAGDGKMTGRWVHALSGANGNETLTPKK